MTDLPIVRGDTYRWTFAITRLDQNDVPQPVPLAGASLWFTVKREWDDPDALAVARKTIGNGITVTNAALGQGFVTLNSGDTTLLASGERLVYDFQLEEANLDVTTVARGAMLLESDVTRATN